MEAPHLCPIGRSVIDRALERRERLWKIFIGVAGVLVLFVAVVATRPAAYHVERRNPTSAPKS